MKEKAVKVKMTRRNPLRKEYCQIVEPNFYSLKTTRNPKDYQDILQSSLAYLVKTLFIYYLISNNIRLTLLCPLVKSTILSTMPKNVLTSPSLLMKPNIFALCT